MEKVCVHGYAHAFGMLAKEFGFESIIVNCIAYLGTNHEGKHVITLIDLGNNWGAYDVAWTSDIRQKRMAKSEFWFDMGSDLLMIEHLYPDISDKEEGELLEFYSHAIQQLKNKQSALEEQDEIYKTYTEFIEWAYNADKTNSFSKVLMDNVVNAYMVNMIRLNNKSRIKSRNDSVYLSIEWIEIERKTEKSLGGISDLDDGNPEFE